MFKNIFGKNKDTSEKKEKTTGIDWVALTSIDQIAIIKEESKENLVGVFKHSTRCSISKTVLRRLENSFPENVAIKMYFIDLLNYREVSNEVGIRFQVVHQSPQLLVVKDGKSVLDASHDDILGVDFNELLK